jgi:threonine dehydratase
MTGSVLDVTLDELEQAAQFVYRTLPPTPQYAWPKLKARAGCTVWVKHENHTPTGAFKVRGGLLYMHRLLHSTPGVAGIVSATRGNHGQSISFAAASAKTRNHLCAVGEFLRSEFGDAGFRCDRDRSRQRFRRGET